MISKKEKEELNYYLEQHNRMYDMFDYDIETLNSLDANWGGSYEAQRYISIDFTIDTNSKLELAITLNIWENDDQPHYCAVIVPNIGEMTWVQPKGTDHFDSLDDLLRFVANGGE